MICCVIANYHPMFGIDLHEGAPTPYGPHVVFAVVRWLVWTEAGEKEATDVVTPAGAVVSKVFNIGWLIPHIPLAPNALAPLLCILSGSKGHFGVASVQTRHGPIAVALMLYANPQVNCNDPIGLPTGAVLAPNLVVAGMTVGDLVAGVVSMVLTTVIDKIIGKVVKFGGKLLGDGIMRGLIGVLPVDLGLATAVLAAAVPKAYPVLTKFVGKIFTKQVSSAVSRGLGVSQWIASQSQGMGQGVQSSMGTTEYFDNSVLLPPFPWGPLQSPLLLRVQ